MLFCGYYCPLCVLQMASIRVSLNQLKEDLDGAVKEQDFTRAAEIKASIAQLDAEKAALLQEAEPTQEQITAEERVCLTHDCMLG